VNSQNPHAGATPFRTREEREADRLQKREAVLRAAVRMFNQRGFHATSLDDVAASLGISKPTIYHYLGNKDQVLLECVTRGLDQLKQAADEAEGASGSGLDRLRGFLRHYAELNMADFGRCVIRTGDEALSPESARQFRALKREVDQAMRRLIAEGMEDGTIAPGNVTLVAFTLAGALNWPARWQDPDKGYSAGELADQLVDILISGIEPRG
jgi:AcrR family transcriptional regulator